MEHQPDLQFLLERAYSEDLGESGDVTTDAIFADERGRAVLLCKQSGVLAGLDAFAAAFQFLDRAADVQAAFRDGETITSGDRVAVVTAPVRVLLSGERTALNLVSYLSGIATVTRAYVDAAKRGGNAEILDTRKTLPAYRQAAKSAVRAGGARNHRMGLYDLVLLKNNHIDACGSISRAVQRIRQRWSDRYRIEVECRTLAEVREALEAAVSIIMLDNMPLESAREAIAVIRRRSRDVKIECSGEMDLEKTERYSSLQPDFISVGRLTHSVEALDFSLRQERT